MPWTFRTRPCLVAGPCVLEEGELVIQIADRLARIGERLRVPVCFKASFDKANRARLAAPRGPGLEEGLAMLEKVRQSTGLPVLTDIHESGQAAPVAEVADALQIPAMLCRQTDLLLAAGRTGLPVNIKKGQWAAPEEMAGAVEKVRATGGSDVAVTERGTAFGYGDLVVDMRSFARLRQATGAPVLFDATHAVQRPGRGQHGASAGDREHVPALLAAAAAAGADGFFLETHPDPGRAASDGATQWPLDQLEGLVERTLTLWRVARGGAVHD
ncbi:MAG TPA: 3-deoxy-8-phosphooctulonate synthase [Gemmatimonadales bacterium]|nr:3-deoxy-8-phosphooctulonate synthase [Gemmatimonadales bacterium]